MYHYLLGRRYIDILSEHDDHLLLGILFIYSIAQQHGVEHVLGLGFPIFLRNVCSPDQIFFIISLSFLVSNSALTPSLVILTFTGIISLVKVGFNIYMSQPPCKAIQDLHVHYILFSYWRPPSPSSSRLLSLKLLTRNKQNCCIIDSTTSILTYRSGCGERTSHTTFVWTRQENKLKTCLSWFRGLW